MAGKKASDVNVGISRASNTEDSWRLRWNERDPMTGLEIRKSKNVKGEKLAKAEAVRIERDLSSGDYLSPSKCTFTEWIDRWITTVIAPAVAKGEMQQRTFEGYRVLLTNHVKPTIGKVRLQDLKPAHFSKLYTHLAAKPLSLSARRIRHVHRAAHVCLRVAIGHGWLKVNPCTGADAPKVGAVDGRSRALSIDDTRSLLRTFEPDAKARRVRDRVHTMLRPLAWLCLTTGVRRGEALGLQWADVDFNAGTITVRRSIEESEDFGVRVKAPKTRAGYRTLDVPKETLDVLRQHRAAHAERWLALGVALTPVAFVFPADTPNAMPTDPMRPGVVTQRWRTHCRLHGIEGVRLHDTRHTHATQYVARVGNNYHATQARLGHSHVSTTMGVYVHHQVEEKHRDAVDGLGREFAAALA